MFVIDIFLNFRTSFSHPLTGDEILDSKKIAKNYVFGGMFWIDFISVVPFDDIL